MCSCRATPRSCTPTSTRSTRRSSSATIPRLRGPAGDRRRRAWCSRPATRPRRSASAPRWAAPRPAACARRRSSSPPRMSAYSRRARRCSRCSRTRRRWSRACRSTRRSSTSAASSGSPARRPRSRPRLRERGGPSRSACRSPSASPARSSSPRSRAASPSPTACSSCRPTASSPSCTRCRSSGCGASGRSPPRSCTDRGITTVGEVARLDGGGAGRDARPGLGPPPPRARPQPRSAAGAGRPPPALDRLAARARAGRDSRRAAIDAVLVGLVDRVTRRMRAAGRVGRTVVLRLRFDDFSRATRSHTLGTATAQTADDPRARRARSLAAAMPMIERQGLTLVGVAVGNLERRRAPSSSRCRSIAAAAARSTPRIDSVRDRFGSGAITRAVLLGRDPGLTGADAAGLSCQPWRLGSGGWTHNAKVRGHTQGHRHRHEVASARSSAVRHATARVGAVIEIALRPEQVGGRFRTALRSGDGGN